MAELNYRSRTLYHADNLDIMRGMNSETVDLIATDPPFNKGRDFHATPDSLAKGASFKDRWSWDRDVHPEWIESLYDDHRAVYEVIEAARHSYGDDMGAFLCWLGVRLIECHRLLKPTGSLYLHIDHTAHAYVQTLLDSIFGAKNRRSTITWKRRSPSVMTKTPRGYVNNSDYLLFYAKSPQAYFYPFTPYTDDEARALGYTLDDNDGKGLYSLVRPYRSKSMGDRPNLCYEWRGFRNPHPSGWASSKEKLEAAYQDGEVIITDEGPYAKMRARGVAGKTYGTVWDDISMAPKSERVGYPTQKPLKLYERIIKASSNPGDLVLDPFAGCATTPVAAERLGRAWVGIDIWEGAHDLVVDRLKAELVEGLNWDESIYYSKTPPVRSDQGEEAVKPFRLKDKYVFELEPWEKLGHGQIRQHLEVAQDLQSGVGCPGCGRVLEKEFMQLDHLVPRSDGGANDITNRALLCTPCNGYKSNKLTLSGLVKRNKSEGWLVNDDLRKQVQKAVAQYSEGVRRGIIPLEVA